MVKSVLKGLLVLVLLLLVVAGGGFIWAKNASAARLAQTFETHRHDFPIPTPLTEADLAELRAQRATEAGSDAGVADPLEGLDLAAIATERAVARGKHLVEARYVCNECHGKDFGGGTMVDAPPIGRILGPNLTQGKGSRTLSYTAADWDRIVRHGVLPDGKPAAMPSADFFAMSDEELSDVISYLRTMPPVDKEVPRPTLGPVGTFLMATGKIRLSAEEVANHKAVNHVAAPPKAAIDTNFGKHLAQVCTGCHRPDLTGGPIAGGPPDWPPAGNLTPHAEGLAGWSYDDFLRALKEAKRKDGTPLRPPMNGMGPVAAQMTETELKAMWAYLQSMPAMPTPK